MHSFRARNLVPWALVPLALCRAELLRAPATNTTYDFIIIGGGLLATSFEITRFKTESTGGTAGNVLANRLTENPHWNVLVLEAGPTQVSLCLISLAELIC